MKPQRAEVEVGGEKRGKKSGCQKCGDRTAGVEWERGRGRVQFKE